MKVRLFRQDTLEDFADHHANGKKHFRSFMTALTYADWEEPADNNRIGGKEKLTIRIY